MAQYYSANKCDECALATWDMKFANLDMDKKPTLLRCPNQKFAIIRGTMACPRFKKGTPAVGPTDIV